MFHCRLLTWVKREGRGGCLPLTFLVVGGGFGQTHILDIHVIFFSAKWCQFKAQINKEVCLRKVFGIKAVNVTCADLLLL